MPNTFINPVVNPDKPLGLNAFTEPVPIQRDAVWFADDVEDIINAIYKQVLSNAYVMESERLPALESQFKQGELDVREFVRAIAYSDLYRTRFFENGSRNRFIELNFKHFLGRAPESRAEVAEHSAILDSQGYEAEIDSYLDSDEYDQAFGSKTVPFYRGYKTEGSTPTGFTHMFSLLRGASSSDKNVTQNNPARLTRALLANKASSISAPSGSTSRQGVRKDLDVNELLRSVFSQLAPAAQSNSARSDSAQSDKLKTQAERSSTEQMQPKNTSADQATLSDKASSQAAQIEQLKKQLAELRSLSTLGEAILRKGQQPSAATVEPSYSVSLSQQVEDQAKQIEKLQGELMSARSLSTIAEFKLNKWRQRSY